MQRILQQTLLASPNLLVCGLLGVLTPTLAQEVPLKSDISVQQTPSAVPTIAAPSAPDSPLSGSVPITQLSVSNSELTNSNSQNSVSNPLAQITSVSQLSDVQPTDWAFPALQSLIERYGCIAGYPDGTFRGNRALTRYEFAAALNACLEQINRQIGASSANFVTKEDVVILQRLQAEFATELTSLGGRTNALETRTAELEANQFSTTTKLYGLTFFNLTDTRTGSPIKAEGTNSFTASRDDTGRPIQRRVHSEGQTTLSYLSWLSLVTSFTGKDSLLMVLATGNGNPAMNELVSAGQTFKGGIPFSVQSGGAVPNQLVVRDFHYSFPVGDRLRVIVGPRVNWFAHFDENVFAPYYLSGLSSYNSINSPLLGNPARGSGAVVEWYMNRQLELHAGYLAENEEFLSGVRTAADPTKGLFGRPNSLTAELTYKPTSQANIRLLYTRNHLSDNGSGQVDASKPLGGILDDGPGGQPNGGLAGLTADVFNVNFDWLLTPRFGLFGRYTYARSHLQVKGGSDKNVNVQAFQAGMAFPDLGKQGALGTLSFAIPMDIVQGRRFFVSGAGNGATQYEIEANYFLPLTDNMAINPAFYVIGNLNNFSSNPTVFVGHLRTQFSF
ncbi:MAG: iron uptake porin [Actinomycetota bacterium]